MDISVIDVSKVTAKTGLVIGKDEAPVKIIEFINVRCPFCKEWFEASYDLLDSKVREGKLQRIIKLFDKEKESLQRGNVMHHYINYNSPEKSLIALKKIFDTQDEWGNLSLDEVATFAETKLHLEKNEQKEISQAIVEEATAANIRFVPTLIINEHIFDESVSKEELMTYLSV